MPEQDTGKKIIALLDHAREKRLDQRRAMCQVCKLDQGVRDQLAEASAQGITRKEQVAWLEDVVGARLTTAQLNAHFSGRHDE